MTACATGTPIRFGASAAATEMGAGREQPLAKVRIRAGIMPKA
jgi:hypothetical protein